MHVPRAGSQGCWPQRLSFPTHMTCRHTAGRARGRPARKTNMLGSPQHGSVRACTWGAGTRHRMGSNPSCRANVAPDTCRAPLEDGGHRHRRGRAGSSLKASLRRLRNGGLGIPFVLSSLALHTVTQAAGMCANLASLCFLCRAQAGAPGQQVRFLC